MELINRTKLQNNIAAIMDHCGEKTVHGLFIAQCIIDSEPVVTSIDKHRAGEWIGSHGAWAFVCSECEFAVTDEASAEIEKYKFCPGCGAYMGIQDNE